MRALEVLGAGAMVACAPADLGTASVGDPVDDPLPDDEASPVPRPGLPSPVAEREPIGGREPREPSWAPVETDLCRGPGWLGLTEDACFYAPAGLSDDAVLVVVYLHGMMPPDGSPIGQQDLVAAAAEENGFVALYPRGRAGLCTWDPSVEPWLCWPTQRATVDAHAADILMEWDHGVERLEHALGRDVTSRAVLGFSNGGYFASYIGLEGLWGALHGVGVVGAGRSFIDPATLGPDRPPFYVAVGAEELLSTQNAAENLAYVLSLEGWPRQFVRHEGSGHTLRPWDIGDAWAFWLSPY